MSKFNTRKLSCIGNCIKPNEKFLHPITLDLIKNEDTLNLCPSILFLNKNKQLTDFKNCDNKNLSSDQLKSFMALPYLNLDSSIILDSIYEINTIDELFNWTQNQIVSKKTYEYINNVINIWNYNNFNDLQKNNKILVELYFKMCKIFWTKITIIDNELKKKIKDYINNWFNKKDINDFYFNLGNDLKKILL